jgi:hypothetical protein
MPLQIRRRRLLLRFAVKIATNPTNPASKLAEPDWQTTYGKYKPGKEPLNAILQHYRPSPKPCAVTRLVLPPWHLKPPLTDSALMQLFSKKTSSLECMKIDSLCHIERYSETTMIFTDASKTKGTISKVAAAFYIKDLKWGHSVRVNDSASIYAAELAAIQMAVDWLLHHGKGLRATIFSDSLSAI